MNWKVSLKKIMNKNNNINQWKVSILLKMKCKVLIQNWKIIIVIEQALLHLLRDYQVNNIVPSNYIINQHLKLKITVIIQQHNHKILEKIINTQVNKDIQKQKMKYQDSMKSLKCQVQRVNQYLRNIIYYMPKRIINNINPM